MATTPHTAEERRASARAYEESRPRGTPSLSELLRNLREEVVRMFRQEIALVRTEVSEQTTRAVRDMMTLMAGGVLAGAGLIVLLNGLAALLSSGLVAAGLDAGIAVWLGPVIVGALVIVIGWIMIAAAKSRARRNVSLPPNTIQSLKDTQHWAQEKVKS